jgi:hypothetical protein
VFVELLVSVGGPHPQAIPLLAKDELDLVAIVVDLEAAGTPQFRRVSAPVAALGNNATPRQFSLVSGCLRDLRR